MTSDPLVVSNTPPLVATAQVEPAEAFEASELSCLASGWLDNDGDPEAYQCSWKVNGVAVATSETLTGDLFARGDSVTCSLTPDDGEDVGTPVPSEPVTVSNTPPVLSSASLDPTSPTEASELTVTLGTASDEDGDTVSYDYAWTVNGTLVATSSSLTGASFARGDSVSCEVTPRDDADPGSPVTTSAVTVANSPPVAVSVVLTPTEPTTGDTIVAESTSIDLDGDAVTWVYSWTVDGVRIAASAASIEGSTWFARGQLVQVEVTPFDGIDSGSALAFTSVEVVNAGPSVASAAISPAIVYEGSTLACEGTGWQDDDGDPEAYGTAWSVNGTEVSTSSSLDGASFDRGDTISCSLTPTGDYDTGAPVSSSTVTVSNSLPSLTGASLSTLSPVPGDTITVTLEGFSDEDGDPAGAHYAWTVSGRTAGTGSSLSSSAFSPGDSIQAQVTAWDGIAEGNTVTTDTAVVAYGPPVISSVTLSPSSPATDDTITAAVVATDLDGDSFSLAYRWTVDGAGVAATGSSLDGATWFERGDSVAVTVTASDATGPSSPVTSAAVTVVNSAPTAPVVSFSPPAPGPDDSIVCVVSTTATDADGDTLSYDISWSVDGVPYSGTTYTSARAGDTVPASATALDELWSCQITADDGWEQSLAGTASATIQDSPGYGPLVYVAEADDHAIMVIDVSTGLVDEAFPMGSACGCSSTEPRGVTYAASSNSFFVTHATSPWATVEYDGDGNYIDYFTSSMGSTGPGMPRALDDWLLVPGGDRGNGAIFLYEISSGSQRDWFSWYGTDTVLGAELVEDWAWTTDYELNMVVAWDLSSGYGSGSLLVSDTGCNHTTGVVLGHTGNLFVACEEGPVQEFDVATGSLVGSLYDGGGSHRDIVYDPYLDSYFISVDASVLQVDSDGVLQAIFTHSDMREATGLSLRYVEE